jgi:ESF2/ABP1 family protein
MKPRKVRQLLSFFGEITNLYLAPEDQSLRRKRKKAGGNTRKNFTEGWVEYSKRRHAKVTAMSLNNSAIGGPKGSYYRDDIWNIKYLKGFQWNHLKEKVAYEKRIRGTKMMAEVAQAKRDSNYYVQQLERAREISKIEERKTADRIKKGGTAGAGGGAGAGAAGGAGGGGGDSLNNRVHRRHAQNAPVPKGEIAGNALMHPKILRKVFSGGAGGGAARRKGKKRPAS